MSVAGRIRCFNAGSFIIDCVDGKAREFELDEIEKKVVFGRLLPKEQRSKFGRPTRKRESLYLDQLQRLHK